jgi:hypothetical protein
MLKNKEKKMSVTYIETITKQRMAMTTYNLLEYYGLDKAMNLILPPASNRELVMRNLTNLKDKDLRSSLSGLQIKSKIGNHAVNTNNAMLSVSGAFRRSLEISSKALTTFQTIEDFRVLPATGLTIGNNVVLVAERLANGKLGSKFAVIPKGLQLAGNKLNWLTAKGNAIGLVLSVGSFTMDRIAGDPIKCSSVFDVGMSAAPVIGAAIAASGGTFGLVVIFVSGVYAAADLASQLVTGVSLSSYVDGACEYVSKAKPSKASSWDNPTAQQMSPDSNDFARYAFMNQGN